MYLNGLVSFVDSRLLFISNFYIIGNVNVSCRFHRGFHRAIREIFVAFYQARAVPVYKVVIQST